MGIIMIEAPISKSSIKRIVLASLEKGRLRRNNEKNQHRSVPTYRSNKRRSLLSFIHSYRVRRGWSVLRTTPASLTSLLDVDDGGIDALAHAAAADKRSTRLNHNHRRCNIPADLGGA